MMLVPLLSGSGMRVKILEGMALGKVVLSTTVGLEGIIGKHKEEFLVADTPEEFMAALDYCYKNPEAMKRIGEAARKVILEEYDNGAIAGRVLEAFGDME
ncbi:MAG: glycosyltransferase involved in cell wall biosynthesis [Polaribacter sp.]